MLGHDTLVFLILCFYCLTSCIYSYKRKKDFSLIFLTCATANLKLKTQQMESHNPNHQIKVHSRSSLLWIPYLHICPLTKASREPQGQHPGSFCRHSDKSCLLCAFPAEVLPSGFSPDYKRTFLWSIYGYIFYALFGVCGYFTV